MGGWLRPRGLKGRVNCCLPVGTSLDSWVYLLGTAVPSLGSREPGCELRGGLPQGRLRQAGLAACPPCRQSGLEDALDLSSLLSYCSVITPEPPVCRFRFAACKALSPLILTENLAGQTRHWAWSHKTRVQVLLSATSLSFSCSTNIHKAATMNQTLS